MKFPITILFLHILHIQAKAQFTPILVDGNINAPGKVMAIDLNNDGLDDILTYETSTKNLIWYECLGSGTFSNANTLSSNFDIDDFAVGDLDNDNDLDIVVVSNSNTTIGILERFNSGNYSSLQTVSTIYTGYRCTLADMDFDNDLDIVSATPTSIRWWENSNATGNFVNWHPIYSNSTSHYDLEAHDFDNDGDVDIFQSLTANDRIVLFEYDNFSYTPKLIDPNIDAPLVLEFHDLNNDGQDELIANSISDEVRIYEYASGSLSLINTIQPASSYLVGQAVADFDNDGLLDIMLSFRDSDTIGYLQNQGGLNFGGFTTISTLQDKPVHLAPGKFDADNSMDLACTSIGGDSLMVYLNQVIVGNDTRKELTAFNLSPNPVKKVLNVQSEIEIKEITIMDVSSQIIRVKQMSPLNRQLLDLEGLPAGHYYLRLRDINENTTCQQFIKM
ncbi:MAG: T9SS type A sorting domain-containing protein [Flavobacteriales bacterium]|nr:T9SS type A sorting domain-containing protein [Flavobacteriales bacterium]